MLPSVKTLVKSVVAGAAVVTAMAVAPTPALANSGCSEPWLNIECEKVYFTVCIGGECFENYVQLYGRKLDE